jgi:hypothetical protein
LETDPLFSGDGRLRLDIADVFCLNFSIKLFFCRIFASITKIKKQVMVRLFVALVMLMMFSSCVTKKNGVLKMIM